MRKLCILIAVSVILGCLVASPVLASPGFSVGLGGGKGLNPEVSPGESYTQTLVVSIGKDDAATDVLIEVLGYGQNADEGVVSLLPGEDNSPYSARTFIQPASITLHLEPGETMSADVTVAIPSNVGSGGRYAILHFITVPPKGGGVSIVSAIVLTMKFTIKDSQLIHTGKITRVTAGKAVSGQPVDIFTNFQNTGNHHFKVKGEVTISDSQGKALDTIYTALTPSSIIHGGTEKLTTTFTPKDELPLGVYTVKSKVMLEDGTVLDQASGSFSMVAPVSAPPSAPATVLTPTPAPPLPPPAPVKSQISWPVIGGGSAAILIIALLIFLLIRRKAY